MELKFSEYRGTGVNHDDEDFHGLFKVESLVGTSTKCFRYLAIRNSDDVKVHEEIGLLTENEAGKPTLHVHMEELPCTTVHTLKESASGRWVFEYKGSDNLKSFSSELVFEFEGEQFKYLHRWAMGGEVSDKSWCLLKPV